MTRRCAGFRLLPGTPGNKRGVWTGPTSVSVSSGVAEATAANGTSPTRITGGGLLLIWCFIFKGGSVPPAPTAPNWVQQRAVLLDADHVDRRVQLERAWLATVPFPLTRAPVPFPLGRVRCPKRW